MYRKEMERHPDKNHKQMDALIETLEIIDSRKEGGNVVSYFCTTQGRVIHFVVGPVDAPSLLREAHWAVACYERALAAAGDDEAAVMQALRDAHELRLSEISAKVELAEDAGRQFSACLTAHQCLIKRPFPLLKEIERDVFETIAGETFQPGGGKHVAVSPTRADTVKRRAWVSPSANNERIASNKLMLAKSLLAANSAAAQRRLRAIVDKYPRTKAAAEARGLMPRSEMLPDQ